MGLLRCIAKLVRKNMAKNKVKRGKSARNGNQPSPYTKYKKKPYRDYSAAYYAWHRSVKGGRTTSGKKDWKASNREQVREFKQAAE